MRAVAGGDACPIKQRCLHHSIPHLTRQKSRDFITRDFHSGNSTHSFAVIGFIKYYLLHIYANNWALVQSDNRRIGCNVSKRALLNQTWLYYDFQSSRWLVKFSLFVDHSQEGNRKITFNIYWSYRLPHIPLRVKEKFVKLASFVNGILESYQHSPIARWS